MTVPTTTPGALGRVRAWITNTRASNDRSIGRRIAGGSLLAALPAIAALALTGALATPGALADQRSTARVSADDCDDKEPILIETRGRWRCQNYYMARVTLDGRNRPGGRRVKTDLLEAGHYVSIECQDFARGEWWDKVLGEYFVPDKYMRTRFTGWIDGAPVCDRDGDPVPRAARAGRFARR